MVGCKFVIKPPKKTTNPFHWLTTLLHFVFFNACEQHQDRRKNEQNVFCIDCSRGFCRHCEVVHHHHRRLQICKYVYHDVVRLQDMQKYLDCSRIQTYKINGEKAIHLNPRPQMKDARPSTKLKTGGTCNACGKYLQDMPNRFCSIACKVSLVAIKSGESDVVSCTSDRESSVSFTDEPPSEVVVTVTELLPRKGLNKRKGIPRRSPLM